MTTRRRAALLVATAMIVFAAGGAWIFYGFDQRSGPPVQDLADLRPLTDAYSDAPSGPRLVVPLSPT